jgi:putative transposase
LNELYRVIGITKQGVNQYHKRQIVFDSRVLELAANAEALRKQHPGCGVEKMYYALKPSFVGRDRFINIMMDIGFRLKHSRNYRRTTYPGRVRHPNLIKGLNVSSPCTIWQSDITYIPILNQFYYAIFIIDVYSKKIVGYKVSKNMRAIANVGALAMALRDNPAPRIHHSDRGSQYGCHQYISLLNNASTQISMGLKAQDNAYAERINRTIKEEYIDHWRPKTYRQLQLQVAKAVNHYNIRRPHSHLNQMAPQEFEEKWHNNQLPNKPTFTIFDENNH